ncbi:acyl-CoA synthetase family member 2, mitochondrial [Plakobranchus ocellatus]|uniref:Acyl-CoA synthetase family member 2, mitochondrial n=1 Tax=Plakobranchus ocellatus TaxID=259542 RepID=A0AAV4DPB2_9GAST|nr:acyl-CoA synthetase family member 2, mitochondrial [Plakobranchus ocellatus]
MGKSLVSEIVQRGKEFPNKPAFVFLGDNSRRTVLTFGDVSYLSQKFAAVLRNKGIGEGDVVCNTLAHSPERLITQVGTIMAGAVFLNGQVCLTDGSDFLRSLNDGRVKAVIYNSKDPRGAYGVLKGRMEKTTGTDKVACADVPTLDTIIPCVQESNKGKDKSLLDELREESGTLCVDRGPASVVAYMCTSGSTGTFKLLSFTSEFLFDAFQDFIRLLDISKDSIYLNDKPFGWIAGFPGIVLFQGCTRVTIEDTVPRDEAYPQFYTEAMRAEQCTCALVTPSLLYHLIEITTSNFKGQSSPLKRVGVGGAPITKMALHSIGPLTERLMILYGSTEAALTAAMSISSCDDYEYEDFLCGWPLQDTQFKIVSSNMIEVPVGQTGEILFKKSLACTSYVNNEQATNDTFLPGGWVRLGDRGYINSKGQITVLGRGAHAIMRGDDVVYPDQLESPILQCPGLAEVIITGVPDPNKFEEMCALLVRQPVAGDELDEADVRRFCQESLFIKPENPEFNPVPKYFRFVQQIPKLNNGKVDRSAAKRMAVELVGKVKL